MMFKSSITLDMHSWQCVMRDGCTLIGNSWYVAELFQAHIMLQVFLCLLDTASAISKIHRVPAYQVESHGMQQGHHMSVQGMAVVMAIFSSCGSAARE